MDLLKDLIKHIQKASYILIAGHISPDGDAIGACTAMGLILEQLNKEYSILLEKPGEQYENLLDHVKVLSEVPTRKCDLFIALDCADIDRLGVFKSVHDGATISWNVDHHISNTNYSLYNHVDSNASSASEIVFNIYKESKVVLNPIIAQAIYTGIVYDTAAFKHSNTTPKTLAIASELLEQPFDFSNIIQKMFYAHPFVAIKLQGAAIKNMESYYDDSLIISTLSQEEIQKYSDDTDGTGGIVNVLKNVKGSKVALFLYEKSENEIKVSMRSEDPYDVCEVAQKFGGGGHKKAAGATINSTLEQAKEQILPLLMELFK